MNPNGSLLSFAFAIASSLFQIQLNLQSIAAMQHPQIVPEVHIHNTLLRRFSTMNQLRLLSLLLRRVILHRVIRLLLSSFPTCILELPRDTTVRCVLFSEIVL